MDVYSAAEESVGVRCNFESACLWTWDINANNTFRVMTLKNLSDAKIVGLLPEPVDDHRTYVINRGHFLHLRMLPTSSIHTLISPTFAGTKEGCHLEMFVHQNGNRNGIFRIVIEPVHTAEVTTSAWVPIERTGNDLRKWDEMSFPIGRVSQPFRILLEVVPKGLRTHQRAYVSIDNLRLRGCFEQNTSVAAVNGKCLFGDMMCRANDVEVCINTRQQCDINVDCDKGEDENNNCGE